MTADEAAAPPVQGAQQGSSMELAGSPAPRAAPVQPPSPEEAPATNTEAMQPPEPAEEAALTQAEAVAPDFETPASPKPPKATTNAPKAARGLDQPARPLPPPPLTPNASSEAPTPSPAPPSKPTSKDKEWSPGAAIDSGNASAASPSLSRNGSRGSATDPSPPSPSGTQSLEWESQASLSPTRSIGPSRRRVESVGSALRQGGRPEQQDRVLVEKAPGVGLIVGVFDGHGGAEAAELASKDLWPRARQRGAGSIERARESLRGAFDDLQTDIDEAHTAWPPNATLRAPSTAGTTAVLCIVRDVGDLIDVAHVGDSRAVVGRRLGGDDVSDGDELTPPQRGRACRAVNLTTDHKCHDVDERRRIEAAGGRVYVYGGARGPVDSRVGLPRLKADCSIQMKRQKVTGEIVDLPFLNMSRALGDCWSRHPLTGIRLVSPEPDITRHTLARTDRFLLLYSDGVSGVLSDDEACRFVADELRVMDAARITGRRGSRRSETNRATRVAERLADYALQKWHDKFGGNATADNVSVVLAIFEDPPPASMQLERAASAPAAVGARGEVRAPVVFAESAPADLVPPSRAATAPLARAYSMAPQTSPTSLKRANKGGAESSDESPRKRSKQPLPSLAE